MAQLYALIYEYAVPAMLGMQFMLILFVLILIHKINAMKRKTDQVIAKVNDYLTVILEDEPEESGVQQTEKKKEQTKALDAEEQNRLISTVLQEIFP
mgnify:FL=1